MPRVAAEKLVMANNWAGRNTHSKVPMGCLQPLFMCIDSMHLFLTRLYGSRAHSIISSIWPMFSVFLCQFFLITFGKAQWPQIFLNKLMDVFYLQISLIYQRYNTSLFIRDIKTTNCNKRSTLINGNIYHLYFLIILSKFFFWMRIICHILYVILGGILPPFSWKNL